MAKDLWARVGITFHLTDNEIQGLLADDNSGMQSRSNIIKKAVADGRFELDGECYSPRGAIEDFNHKYGTDYPEDDYDFYW